MRVHKIYKEIAACEKIRETLFEKDAIGFRVLKNEWNS